MCGFFAAAIAVLLICTWPGSWVVAALFVWFAWLYDLTDGALARVQGTTSSRGAWLDANLDELADVALHVAIAYAIVTRTGEQTAWLLVILFLAGKYLFSYGLGLEHEIRTAGRSGRSDSDRSEGAEDDASTNHLFDPSGRKLSKTREGSSPLLRRLYHLPGNVDVRVHVLLATLLLGWLETELWFVAGYYNARCLARYVLVPRRLPGPASSLIRRYGSPAPFKQAAHDGKRSEAGILTSSAGPSSTNGAAA